MTRNVNAIVPSVLNFIPRISAYFEFNTVSHPSPGRHKADTFVKEITIENVRAIKDNINKIVYLSLGVILNLKLTALHKFLGHFH